jgi:uncharacterized protein involved in exopolysaccharide biosynthesis
MLDSFKRDPDLESDKITLISKVNTMPQKLETPQTTDRSQQIDSPQFQQSSNSINDLDLLPTLQRMKAEEQQLLENKQLLLAEEQNLLSKIVKEIDKKKTAINNLKTEISDLLNRCKELSQHFEELSK